MVEDNENLSSVYGAENSDATRSAYEGWAEGYDAENLGNGYRVPGIGTAMIARHVTRGTGPIYDAACGTGIIGGMLDLLGYESIFGSDLSPAMLNFAGSPKPYTRVYEHDLGEPLPEEDNKFAAVTCFGSLGPGHAPPKCMDEFVRITKPGGHVIFNTRAETYSEQELKQKVDDLMNTGAWTLVDQSPIFRSYYFIEPDVTSQVYVFQVA
ncbi:ubiquinone/menaquinone biosynthesis methyltransferase [Roseovarius albus]|uniref:Ubiquinone/menaquinone biosynthesis methyltransferase n=1 Tax=Roseovarius albus TaxID=1247867 RepID=A0A1X7A8W3_9RHOB|nr:class I SAM-dependent methyltransferase [Roseovarius albus]SLN73114.1 ubiquinone/menaquinone biosynthesis methyltransferase [Roseovarius albus]